MSQFYDVKVPGPLPDAVLAALGQVRIGTLGARTVLRAPTRDGDRLPAVMERLSALGLELSELRRGQRYAEVEIRGLLGPALQAALSDATVPVARWRCVLVLRLPGLRLAAALQALTEGGVDLLGIRASSLAPVAAGC